MTEGQEQAAAQYAAIVQLLADLDAAEDSDEDEAARQRIADHPLHVLVRSDWTQPGDPLEAAEFQILLCTGGPAVRIVGELDRGTPCSARLEYQDWDTPCSARLEYQDWDTPWLSYSGALPAVLCDYAANFYFGE